MLKHFARLLALALAVLALVACAGVGRSPESTAKAFVEAQYRGDADEMIAIVRLPPGRTVEKAVAQRKLRAAAAEGERLARQHGGLRGITVKSSHISGRNPNHAITVLSVRFKNGEKEELVRIIRLNGTWQVLLP